MLRSYLNIAFHTLKRSKSYTALNVGGLAVALATVSRQALRAARLNPADALRDE